MGSPGLGVGIMPSIHIPEGAFDTLSNEYGYTGAKERVKDLVKEEASRIGEQE